jgi:hypothetical protein
MGKHILLSQRGVVEANIAGEVSLNLQLKSAAKKNIFAGRKKLPMRILRKGNARWSVHHQHSQR